MAASYVKSRTVSILLLVLLSLPSLSAQAALLQQQDQNPFARAFLPPPMDTQRQPPGVSAALSVTNTLNGEGEAGVDTTLMRIDSELVVLNLAWWMALQHGWLAALELPLLHQGGGVFDGVISDYHELFGMPNWRRSHNPDGGFYYQVLHQGVMLVDVGDSGSQWGDLALSLQRQWRRPTRQLSARLRLELPSGDSDSLAGSGSVDLAATLNLAQQWRQRWVSEAEVTVQLSSRGEIMPRWQNRSLTMLSAGLGYQLSPALLLATQIELHSAVFELPGLRYLDDTAVLSVGGWLQLSPDTRFDVSVNEDIKINASPDISVRLGLTQQW